MMLSAFGIRQRRERPCHSSSVMKGHDWVQQAQDGFEYAHEGAACGALGCRAAGLDLHFCQLDVPVAIFVPHKFVQRLRGKVKAVGFKGFGNGGFGLLQLADNPLVGEGKRQRLHFVLTAVFVFGVHQHEVGGVPQFYCRSCGSLRRV